MVLGNPVLDMPLRNKSMQKYIHIGYPKNLSTTLQRDFFSKHKEIMHLGVGCHDHNLGYIDHDVRNCVEHDFRYVKDSIYSDKRETVKDIFQRYFDLAVEKNFKAIGLSNEHLSFNFTPDNIDISQKAKRLYDVFGHNTKVIIIIRNQMDLLKSLYAESVRLGYPYDYHRFIEYCYFYKERNFICDFQYDKILEIYASFFGKENLIVIPFEDFVDDQNKELVMHDQKYSILKKICHFLDLNYDHDIKLGHFNHKLDETVTVLKKDLNKAYPHDLGNTVFSAVEANRLWHYFEDELKIPMPFEAKNDVYQKQKLIKIAELEKKDRGLDLKIDYNCDADLIDRLYQFFASSNTNFMEMSGLDLKGFDYPHLS